MDGLHLVTDLDAAHTFDAFLIISVERVGCGPGSSRAFRQFPFVGKGNDAKGVCQALELAAAASYTGGAQTVMLA